MPKRFCLYGVWRTMAYLLLSLYGLFIIFIILYILFLEPYYQYTVWYNTHLLCWVLFVYHVVTFFDLFLLFYLSVLFGKLLIMRRGRIPKRSTVSIVQHIWNLDLFDHRRTRNYLCVYFVKRMCYLWGIESSRLQDHLYKIHPNKKNKNLLFFTNIKDTFLKAPSISDFLSTSST